MLVKFSLVAIVAHVGGMPYMVNTWYNVNIMLPYQPQQQSRAKSCEGVNGGLAIITYVKRITYMIDKTLHALY